MGAAHEGLIDDGQRSCLHGHVQGVEVRFIEGVEPQSVQQQIHGHLAAGRRGRHLGARGAEGAQRLDAEGGDDGPRRAPVVAQVPAQPGLAALGAALELDEQAVLREGAQQLDQRRDAQPLPAVRVARPPIGTPVVPRVEGLQLRQIQIVDAPRALGDAVDAPVVDDDEDTVGGAVHVQLEHVDAEVGDVPIERQRALRRHLGTAAVGDDEDAIFGTGEVRAQRPVRRRQQGRHQPGAGDDEEGDAELATAAHSGGTAQTTISGM